MKKLQQHGRREITRASPEWYGAYTPPEAREWERRRVTRAARWLPADPMVVIPGSVTVNPQDSRFILRNSAW